ncbi:hypothetical protein GmHk_09G025407 [Glycine max]|nr:hypothetical protein GmHk_09G025407 [Glycine max]
MSRNFTNCLTMGAKYLEVVKRGSHPNNGWSPDEIRAQNDHNVSLHVFGDDRAWVARRRMTIICLCVPPDMIASGWRKEVVCAEDDVNLRVSTGLWAAIDKGCRRRRYSLRAIML